MASTCDADHDGPLRCQFGALKVRTHLALIETRNLSESDADCVSLHGSAPSFQRRRSTRDRSPALRVHRGFRRQVAQADQRLACSKTSASSGTINRNFFDWKTLRKTESTMKATLPVQVSLRPSRESVTASSPMKRSKCAGSEWLT